MLLIMKDPCTYPVYSLPRPFPGRLILLVLMGLLLVTPLISGQSGNAALTKSEPAPEVLGKAPSSRHANPVMAILDFNTDTLDTPDIKALSHTLWTQVYSRGGIDMLPREPTRNWLISHDLHPYMPYQDRVPPDRILETLAVDYLLLGTINQLEESFTLDLSLYTAPDGRALMFNTTVKRADLNEMLESMSNVAQYIYRRVSWHHQMNGTSEVSMQFRPARTTRKSLAKPEESLHRRQDQSDLSEAFALHAKPSYSESGDLVAGLNTSRTKPASLKVKKIVSQDKVIHESGSGMADDEQEVVYLEPITSSPSGQHDTKTVASAVTLPEPPPSSHDSQHKAIKPVPTPAHTSVPMIQDTEAMHPSKSVSSHDIPEVQNEIIDKRHPKKHEDRQGGIDTKKHEGQQEDSHTTMRESQAKTSPPETHNLKKPDHKSAVTPAAPKNAERDKNTHLDPGKSHHDKNAGNTHESGDQDEGKANQPHPEKAPSQHVAKHPIDGPKGEILKEAKNMYNAGLKMPVGSPRRLKTFEDVVKLVPAESRYRKRLAKEYYTHSLYPECIGICREILSDHPKDSMLLTLKGSAHYGMKQYDESIEANKAAMAANPGNNWARFNYALTLMAADSPEAAKAWQDFIEHGRNDSKPAIQALLGPAGEYLSQVSRP
jgi:hypothetical protein